MVKISGFVLSALLVVFCLWLSVFSFPDVIQPGDLASLDALNAAERASQAVESNETNVPLDSATALEPQDSALPAENEKPSESTDSSSEQAPTQAGMDLNESNLGFAQTSSAVAVAKSSQPKSKSETKDALKASGRAQGGKYVSIPSVEMDAFHAPMNGAPYTNRVISATRAVVPQVDPAYN